MNAQMAQTIFAAAPVVKKRNSKEDQPTNYKSTNESLVKRNLMYKQQLVQASKTIEKLRDENVALRQRNQELMDTSDERKLELIVEQRVRSRLAHAAVLNKKLVKILQQTGSELTGLFKDFEPAEPSNLNSKRMPKLELSCLRRNRAPFQPVLFRASSIR
uniref:Shugoshin C-terminal domain-containing protein n=1 Tax=Caenorhabditis japonica TaxID=281687 RepID=A0A8R1E831_CAEJA